MSEAESTRIHEVDFCAEVAKWADDIFRRLSNCPFEKARIEGFGTRQQRRKRKDLRFYDKNGRIAITGETKLPGTPEGRSPFDDDLVQEAQTKADNAGARYFFTWNVNSFVLWDRYQQNKPLLDRRVRDWNTGRIFRGADDVGRPENQAFLKDDFLPGLLAEISDIYAGRRSDWQLAPDDLFIRSLESHLAWPTELTHVYLLNQSENSTAFGLRLEAWLREQSWQFVRRPIELWSQALDRAARTIVYVLANRLIFYQALRARFPELPAVHLSSRAKADEAYAALMHAFARAVRRTGDYQPLFYPDEKHDWAGPLVFAHPNALDSWRGALRGIESYDFSRLPSDIVGRIFQRLISPEERHRWGQHFTGDDVVDLINSFCIRDAGATVLDPACGSGSFLVRAYYRKRHLKRKKPHAELLSELFGLTSRSIRLIWRR